MEAKKGRKERNRESIVRAALELFRSQGFKRISIEDVARQAGVSPATVYNHFGDKDGLVRASVIGQFEVVMDWYRDLMRSDLPFTEKLEALAHKKTEQFERFGGEWLQTLVKSSPEVARYARETSQETGRLFMQLLEEGRQQGYVDPDLSPEAIKLHFEIYQTGTMAVMPRLSEAENGPRLAKEMMAIYIYGLVGNKGKRPGK